MHIIYQASMQSREVQIVNVLENRSHQKRTNQCSKVALVGLRFTQPIEESATVGVFRTDTEPKINFLSVYGRTLSVAIGQTVENWHGSRDFRPPTCVYQSLDGVRITEQRFNLEILLVDVWCTAVLS